MYVTILDEKMNIKLNFLPLDKSDFTLNVFYKVYDKNNNKEEDIVVYKIPDEKGQYQEYAISFDAKNRFTDKKLNSFNNIELTKKYIFSKCTAIGDKINYPIEIPKNFKQELFIEIHSTNKGSQCIFLTPYYLETTKQFGFLIDFRFKKNIDIPFDIEVQKLSLSLDKYGRNNRNYYTDKYKKIIQIIPKLIKAYSITDGTDIIHLQEDFVLLESERLAVKNYVLSKNNTSNSQFMGIKEYGPFMEIDSKINFLFVFEDRLRLFANDIYYGLLGKLSPGTFPGLKKMFKIDFSKDNVKKIPFYSNSVEEIDKAVDLISKEVDGKNIVIFIEIGNKDDELTNRNYYYFKYKLAKRKIPLQVISYKNLGSANRLKWSISNLGLQIFAKIGGIPWLIKSQNKSLILGIGSAHKIQDNKVKKYFAYTVCLDSTGLYKKVEILSSSEEEINYLGELKKNLVSLLKGNEFSNYKKCALHIPFKIKKKEIQAIKDAIKEVEQIEFVVIKINTENKFFGYALNNTMVPYESSFIRLDKNQFLVWFEGLQYGKELVYKRTANPVHIQFLEMPDASNYKEYLQDIINLSGANWRGFNSKAIPVSIYYSKIIADYTSYFESYDDFESSEISNIKPWFL